MKTKYWGLMQKDINRVFPAKKDLDLLELYAEVSSFNRWSKHGNNQRIIIFED